MSAHYKVWIGNIAVECDSVEAVLALAKADGASAAGSKSSQTKPADISTGESRWTPKRAKDFFDNLDGHQKKLIDLLMANTEGQTDEQLLRLLSLGSGRALGGVMSGASKNAKKVGADPDDLVRKEHVTIDGKHAKEYFLTESFRKAALQVQR
jgi:NADPH-dependent curcumin reductase CurA